MYLTITVRETVKYITDTMMVHVKFVCVCVCLDEDTCFVGTVFGNKIEWNQLLSVSGLRHTFFRHYWFTDKNRRSMSAVKLRALTEIPMHRISPHNFIRKASSEITIDIAIERKMFYSFFKVFQSVLQRLVSILHTYLFSVIVKWNYELINYCILIKITSFNNQYLTVYSTVNNQLDSKDIQRIFSCRYRQ